MSPRVGRRRLAGFTLLEALIGLLLSALLVSLILTTLSRHREVVRVLAVRGERLAALRVARHVLGAEARAAAGDGAWRVGEDSMALRAFRGHALACRSSAGAEELYVAAAGTRAPDPAKDSVLLVLSDGAVVVRGLRERSPAAAACPGWGRSAERWLLDEAVPAPVVAARWFERGAYHLAAGALRYRRGLAGRQPLTPEVLGTPESAFHPRAAGVAVQLVPDGGEPLSSWALFLEGPPGG